MKWRFEDASKFFKSERLEKTFEDLFDEICVIVAKTFVAADERMCEPINRAQKTRNVSFELFGFDILVDSNLKPWILEVILVDQCNVGPSMNQDSEVDKLVKVPLVTDMANLLCLKPYRRYSNNMKLTKTAQRFLAEVGKPKSKMTTPKEIEMLTQGNFKQILKADDYLTLFEFSDEFSRRGNFKLAFPTPQMVEALRPVFDVERANNMLLWKYLDWRREGFDLLQSVCRSQ